MPIQSKPVILISAVNLTVGGPLSVLKDAVNVFVRDYLSEYKLVLFVNNKSLFSDIAHHKEIEFHQFAYPKRSWLLRMWFEYIHCWFISKKIKADVWIALNDLTPNATAKTKIVYCHNPAPFYELDKDITWRKKLFFFHFFYNFFYSINIRSNKYVFVQQQWMRDEFKKLFALNNIVVAHPDVQKPQELITPDTSKDKFRFFYPALPRVSKNFETLFEAVKQLAKINSGFELIVTFNGSENIYASQLIDQYSGLSCIKFIGEQSREDVWKLYATSSCLVFPSKMETWGLPITEMKTFNKPIIVANCKYANETVGSYDKVCFFEAGDVATLASLMEKTINGTLEYDRRNYQQPSPLFVQSWQEFYALILADFETKQSNKKLQPAHNAE